uniref:Uncharacterized protein n=1 Tax=Meloidogyne enterolobii TaxID=390850 RepID=A0A6V7UY62_MELEN|nr:unnamed protein product [Meloidogyne enterolobii]
MFGQVDIRENCKLIFVNFGSTLKLTFLSWIQFHFCCWHIRQTLPQGFWFWRRWALFQFNINFVSNRQFV